MGIQILEADRKLEEKRSKGFARWILGEDGGEDWPPTSIGD